MAGVRRGSRLMSLTSPALGRLGCPTSLPRFRTADPRLRRTDADGAAGHPRAETAFGDACHPRALRHFRTAAVAYARLAPCSELKAALAQVPPPWPLRSAAWGLEMP